MSFLPKRLSERKKKTNCLKWSDSSCFNTGNHVLLLKNDLHGEKQQADVFSGFVAFVQAPARSGSVLFGLTVLVLAVSLKLGQPRPRNRENLSLR